MISGIEASGKQVVSSGLFVSYISGSQVVVRNPELLACLNAILNANYNIYELYLLYIFLIII